MFCVTKETMGKMKDAFKKGEWTPAKFTSLSSAESRKQLTDIIGNEEEAKKINLLLERKMLLKNQELAMFNFVKDVVGLNVDQKQEMSKKIKAVWAEKKRLVESPKENEKKLLEIINETYNKKFKLDIDLETSSEILEFASGYYDAKEKVDGILEEDGSFKETKENRVIADEFGVKQYAYFKFIKALRENAKQNTYSPLSKQNTKKDNLRVMKKNIKEFGIGGVYKFLAQNTRALKATFDNSFVGRQARTTMQPRFRKEWWSMFAKSFRDIKDVLFSDFSKDGIQKLKTKGQRGEWLKSFVLGTSARAKAEAIEDAQMAEIFSRQNSINGRYTNKEGKLDIGVIEEDIPTLDLEKIPLIGRFFVASDIAYKISAIRLRADVADNLFALSESKNTFLSDTFKHSPHLKEKFKKEAIDLTDDFQVGSINKVVNDMTGRGAISHRVLGEKGQELTNELFFSIKFAQSQINTLLSWAYFPTKKHAGRSKFARKQAAKNLLWQLATSYVLMGMYSVLGGDEDRVEWDLTSSESGKVIKKNTRTDVSGGLFSYITLLSRIITHKRKSTITGLKREIGEGFGSGNTMDIIWDFIENKTSPFASLIKNQLNREAFGGEELTTKRVLTDSFVPIILETAKEAREIDGNAMMLYALIADGLGASVGSYGYSGRWTESTSQWADKFKKEKGKTNLKQAGDIYDKMVGEYIIKQRKNDSFLKLTPDEQMKELNKEKRKIKKEVFKVYKFKE